MLAGPSLSYDSRLQFSEPHLEPQKYVPGDIENHRPPPNFIISKDELGNVLSRYDDSSFWDLTPYLTTQCREGRLYWNSIEKLYVEDAKWLVFILMYFVNSGRASTLTVGSLINYLKVIKKLCVYAFENSTSITSVLGTDKHVAKFVKDKINNIHNLKYFVSLLKHLLLIGQEMTGISALSGRTIDDIRSYQSRLSTSKQHPVIPPRIFSNFLAELWALLNTFEKNKENLIPFIERCIEDRTFGRGAGSSSKSYPTMSILQPMSFEEGAKHYGVLSYFQNVGIKNVTNLQGYIIAVQDAGRHLLHSYSGMRQDEMKSLMLDCIVSEFREDGTIVRLLGKTSKLIGQRKTVAWITSKESVSIVCTLSDIAKLVTNDKCFTEDEIPLFANPSYLGFVGKSPTTKFCSIANNKSFMIAKYISMGMIKIEEEDLTFLEMIDHERAWRQEDKYQIGTAWGFTSHQYRRTLAYYCKQSGLVKLSTLKRQLKHLTKEMSLYYASGSPYDELFKNKDHFKQTYSTTESEVKTLVYVFEILLSDERLYGASGKYIERFNKPNTDTERIQILRDRKKIKKGFEKGELSYSETPLGGCTTTKPCDKKLLGILSACLSCPNAILKQSKISNAITQHERFIDALDPTSAEYKMETSDLDSLLKFNRGLKKGI